MKKLTASKALERVLLRLDEMAHAKENAEVETVHSLLDSFRIARTVHERMDAAPIKRRRLTLLERVATLAYWAASTTTPDKVFEIHQKLMEAMTGCKLEVSRPGPHDDPTRGTLGHPLSSR